MFPDPLRMKRLSTVLAASAAIVTLHGQVITSVQDGAWSDPATWDCNCVPPVPAEMVVMHNVNLSGGLSFSPSLTILASGQLQQISPGYIYSQGPLIVAGTLSSPGFLAPGCPVILSGSILAESLYLGGGMQMIGGFVQVSGNFTQAAGAIVDGDGQICVGDSSNIQGPLTGTIDLCDLTPTTTVPPFVDGGASFVGPNITFCQGAVCAMGVQDRAVVLELSAYPVPATNELTVSGAFKGSVEVRVLDELGSVRSVRWERRDDRMTVHIEDLRPGLYLMEVRSAGRSGVLRFMKE